MMEGRGDCRNLGTLYSRRQYLVAYNRGQARQFWYLVLLVAYNRGQARQFWLLVACNRGQNRQFW